jgi:hypothetical protein
LEVEGFRAKSYSGRAYRSIEPCQLSGRRLSKTLSL